MTGQPKTAWEHIAPWLLAAAIVGVLALLASGVESQRDARADLALALAVVAAHEGALDNLRDTDLVWQVVESRASSTAGRLRFLRQHSPRALGLEPCNGRNCVWSVDLLRDPDATPQNTDQGYWRSVRAPQWRLIRERAMALVYGAADDARPCLRAPYTWGGAMDHAGALKRGLRPLGCSGTLNDGFELKAAAVSAQEASAGR